METLIKIVRLPFNKKLSYTKMFLVNELKKIYSWYNKSQQPNAKVLIVSLPKSGTHLVENILYSIPSYYLRQIRTMLCTDSILKSDLKKIERLKKGEFLLSHIAPLPEILEAVNKWDIKVLFVTRDPRSVVVSHAKYVTEFNSTHPAHNYFKNLPNYHDRYNAAIDGVINVVEPLNIVMDRMSGWLQCKNSLHIKFEDLIGTKGGGDNTIQYLTIKKIFAHINFQTDDIFIQKLCQSLFGKKNLTYRAGQINEWKDELNQEHLNKLEKILLKYNRY